MAWLPSAARCAMRTYFSPLFIDQREPPHALFVAGKLLPHILQMAAVDLVDDLQMPRQQGAEEGARPLLQGLRQQGVVGVGKSMLRHVPRGLPLHGIFIDEQAHQLGHGDGGMRVVHLDGEVAMQFGQRPFGVALNLQDVLQAAGDEEELLRQPELLALYAFVVGIKNFGDVFRGDLVGHRAEEVSSD